MSLPPPNSARCARCGSKLAYDGRPCPLCISPATYRLGDAGRTVQGDARPEVACLPKFALASIRLPGARRERMIATLRLVEKWTWRSLGIAACLHVGVLAVAMFMGAEIEALVIRVQKVNLNDRLMSIPPPERAPEEMPSLAPDIKEEELVVPERVTDETLDVGEPEPELPPDRPNLPEPQVERPRPANELILPARQRDQPAGLGAGLPQDEPSPNAGSGLFENRQGQSRDSALKRFGGGEDTEGAVNLGLEYLSRQQSTDGSWDPNRGFKDPPDWARRGNGYKGKVTALCALPFLAAGNSPEQGRYKGNVRRVIRWLTNRQASDGCISDNESGDMYMHAVATLALCEAYAMTQDRATGTAAERAVRFIERSQGAGGGWDYNGYVTMARNRVGERNDGSITGWGVLALKSARSAGITVNERAWSQMAELYDRLSIDSGETYYADQAYGHLSGTRRGIGMVGVGLASRVMLGDSRFARRNRAAENLLLDNLPAWERLHDPTEGAENPNFNTFYGWYYSTLGMFLKNSGEGAAWTRWNEAIKNALLPQQVKVGARRGSWPAADSWIGPIMGDLYSTACAVLCLEVYYRYNPQARMSASARANVEVQPRPRAQPTASPTESASSRSAELRALARNRGADAQPDLIAALRDDAAAVRSTALFELGRLKSADAAPAVAEMLHTSENESLRLTIIDTLGRLGAKSVYPSLVRLLSDPETYVQEAARSALSRLAGGKDFGINKRAWQDWFERNP